MFFNVVFVNTVDMKTIFSRELIQVCIFNDTVQHIGPEPTLMTYILIIAFIVCLL